MAGPGIRIALSALAFGLVLLTGAKKQPAARLVVRPSPVVWMEPGAFVMGADEPEIDYAVELCVRERALPVRSLGPLSDGACSFRRFAAVEAPRHRAYTEAFGLDRTEVTNAAYRACVVAGRCPPSRIPEADEQRAHPEVPVSGVTAAEAERYCAFRGGRLPTEVEWERAARGSVRHRFPWGRHYNDGLANHGRAPAGPDDGDGFREAAPVGSFPDGASDHGILDLAGNVWEWTQSNPGVDETGPGSDPTVYRVIRGGSWNQPPEALRVTYRAWVPASDQFGDLGFRCAYDRR